MRLFLIALFFITLAGSAADAQSLARETPFVFGPVKTIRYDKIEGPRDFYEVASFDGSGNLMERTIYKYDDALIGKVIYLRNDGKLAEIKYYQPSGSLASKEIYRYSAQGRVSEIAYYDTDTLVYKYIYKWNLNGKRAEVKRVHPPGDRVLINGVNKYDGRGNIIESVFYNSDGKAEMKETYKYDVRGNPIKGIIRNSVGLSIETYAYKFDMNGNWIRSTLKKINNDGEVSLEVIQRNIIYNSK